MAGDGAKALLNRDKILKGLESMLKSLDFILKTVKNN